MTNARVKVDGEWKKVSSIKVKVNGKWENVISAYKKMSGEWKKFFEVIKAKVLSYYGTATNLREAGGLSAGSNKNYAIFGGTEVAKRYYQNGWKTKIIGGKDPSAYDENLIRYSPPNMTEPNSGEGSFYHTVGVGTEEYVMFGGGSFKDRNNKTYQSSAVTIYNSNLTKTEKYLTYNANWMGAVAIADYVIFAGGSRGYNTINEANVLNIATLTTSPLDNFEKYFQGTSHSYCSIGSYALFGEGSPVVYYTSSLVRGAIDNTEAKNGGVSFAGYALFGNGVYFDKNLVKSTTGGLSNVTAKPIAFADYALFGKTIEISTYDKNLVITFNHPIFKVDSKKYRYAFATIGDYLLQGGGTFSDDTKYNTVDVFEYK